MIAPTVAASLLGAATLFLISSRRNVGTHTILDILYSLKVKVTLQDLYDVADAAAVSYLAASDCSIGAGISARVRPDIDTAAAPHKRRRQGAADAAAHAAQPEDSAAMEVDAEGFQKVRTRRGAPRSPKTVLVVAPENAAPAACRVSTPPPPPAAHAVVPVAPARPAVLSPPLPRGPSVQPPPQPNPPAATLPAPQPTDSVSRAPPSPCGEAGGRGAADNGRSPPSPCSLGARADEPHPATAARGRSHAEEYHAHKQPPRGSALVISRSIKAKGPLRTKRSADRAYARLTACHRAAYEPDDELVTLAESDGSGWHDY